MCASPWFRGMGNVQFVLGPLLTEISTTLHMTEPTPTVNKVTKLRTWLDCDANNTIVLSHGDINYVFQKKLLHGRRNIISTTQATMEPQAPLRWLDLQAVGRLAIQENNRVET